MERGMFVLPSTAHHAAALPSWIADGDFIVAPLWGYPATRLVEQLVASRAPSRVVFFSDQCVSCLDAPIHVIRKGYATSLSTVEVLAARNFGYTLRVWDGKACVEVRDTTTERVLGVLLDYLHACAALGEAWLARDAQGQRCPSARRRAAMTRTRMAQSLLMQGIAPDGSIPVRVRAGLRRLAMLHQRLERIPCAVR